VATVLTALAALALFSWVSGASSSLAGVVLAVYLPAALVGSMVALLVSRSVPDSVIAVPCGLAMAYLTGVIVANMFFGGN
jgi:hypothetical protein